MQEIIKKEAVHVGYGVKMRMVDGRLRITVPCNKRWRGGMFWALSAFWMLIVSANLFVFRWQSARIGSLPAPSFWFYVIVIGFWLVVTPLVICAILWFLRGHYVLEIGEKMVQVGRSLHKYDLLATHDAAGLRRIRFAPALNVDYKNGRGKYSMGGQIFKPGHYNLHLDYGSKQPEVLHMAVEEGQVRAIKQIIHTHYPHLYHSGLQEEKTADSYDPLIDILEIKRQLK